MNLSWKAENYEQFADMTIEELNKFTGRNRSGSNVRMKSVNKAKTKAKNKLESYKTNKPRPSTPLPYKKKLTKRRIPDFFFGLMRFKEKNSERSVFDTLGVKTENNKLLKKLSTTIKKKTKIPPEEEVDPDFKDLPRNFLKWRSICSPSESQVCYKC